MKSLKWLSVLGLVCTTIIKTLSVYAAFDTSRLSADLKYIATGDLSTLRTLRPSELAGSIFPALTFTGARLQAAGPGWAGVGAARRGFSAVRGHNCWPCTIPVQMAWLAAVPGFVYVNLSCWLPGAVWNLLRLWIWQISFTPASHDTGAILNWPMGLASVRSSCQGAKME